MTVPGSYWERKEPEAAPASAAQPPVPEVGYAEDIAKGAAGGLGRGLTGLAGLPGDISEYGARGLDYATRKVGGWLGQDIAPRQAVEPSYGSAAAQRNVEKVTGKFYEPKTIPGQYASTIGEFAPGALIPGSAAARAVNTVVPALASETAGQITKDSVAEPYARAVGGIAGGVGGAKLITPAAPQTAARQAAVDVLQGEGIPLSAGQRTGSRPIQWMESVAADTPGSATRAGQIQAATKGAYDRAITDRVFDRNQLNAELARRGQPEGLNLPDPRVAGGTAPNLSAGPQTLSNEYARLTQNQLQSNPQLNRRMRQAQDEYERLVLPHEQTPNVRQTRDDITLRLIGSGRMAGDEYQSIRSQIGRSAKSATNPQEATALRELKFAMDEAMQAGLSPADARAWALNNRRYANMKQLDPAVASAGENLSPARVAQSVRAGRGAQYAGQGGDLDELAKAGSIVLKDLPQSGTGPRTAMQSLFNIPNVLAAGGGTLGSMFGPYGAILGAGAPFAASRAVVSRPGQAYLGNRALPQRGRDVIAQTLAQQAISRPSGIERNRREREEYERKRKR